MSDSLEDTQAQGDVRGVRIQSVGVSALRWPCQLFDGQDWQSVVIEWRLGVELPERERGTHMSRFVQWLRDGTQRFRLSDLPDLVEQLRGRLDAPAAHVELRTELFRQLAAPVSGEMGMVALQLGYTVDAREHQESVARAWVEQPVATLCPCSKAISERGAHNQRGRVRVDWKLLDAQQGFSVQEFAALIDECGSAPLYSVLKRGDEKAVTELAYDQPAFVEDVVRECVLRLRERGLGWFRVEVENFESIHQHNAWAVVEEGVGSRE